MIAVYCRGDAYAARIRAALPDTEAVVTTGDWHALQHAAPGADCSVIVIEWLFQQSDFNALCDFRHRMASRPIVLITYESAENVRCLKAIVIEEVLWIGELERELPHAVTRTRKHRLLVSLADAISAAEHLPPTLRHALAHACRRPCPTRSVIELASAVGRHPSTLWWHWHRSVQRDPPLRLEDFLDWVLLISAVSRRHPGLSWAVVAAELGVHEHTLARSARRLTGTRLSELTTGAASRIRGLLARDVLPCLLLRNDFDLPG